MVQNTKSLPLLDLETVGGEEITIDDMVDHLKNGKIIGFIQGNIELGARALGNRSILCDPSIPDMKDILNAKVKKREWYRPFGPMCRLEDAHIWFESPTFDNMQFMSFTPDVKEEYRDVFPSITHVDGTARLQTVTKESNPFIYELLTKFETPLLNTSFNVQGKPILNRLEHALKVLHETDLDYVVVRKDGKLYVYR
jgi:carbamoyltransferase